MKCSFFTGTAEEFSPDISKMKSASAPLKKWSKNRYSTRDQSGKIVHCGFWGSLCRLLCARKLVIYLLTDRALGSGYSQLPAISWKRGIDGSICSMTTATTVTLPGYNIEIQIRSIFVYVGLLVVRSVFGRYCNKLLLF
jgi:hypothetical protein